MDRTDTIITIVKEVSKKKSVPEMDESLFDSGYLDSFAFPDMLNALEAQFDIKIPDSDLNPSKFESIQRIDRYIARALAAPKA